MNSRNDTEFDEDVMFVDMPSDGGADPLALFESESDPDQAGGPAPLESKDASPAASLTRVRRPMALDQVLHRLGSVSWAEAVAIDSLPQGEDVREIAYLLKRLPGRLRRVRG